MIGIRTVQTVLPRSRVTAPRLVALGASAAGGASLIAIHRFVIALPWSQTTLLAPFDALFSLLFVLAMLLLAWAAGLRLLRSMPIVWHSRLELATFSIACGLALFAYLTLAITLARLLYPYVVLALTGALLWLLRGDLREVAGDVRAAAGAVVGFGRRGKGVAPAVAAVGLIILLFALPTAVMPPFSYDALLYHLSVPKMFVEQHRYVVVPTIAQASFPFTVEMLYTLCLLFGSEAGAALLHLSFGVLTALAIWCFAARWFSARAGWFAVAAFISASEVTHWAPAADIDLALTLYSFLALYAGMAWLSGRQSALLALGAVMAGIAMGIKYTAAATVLVVVLLVLTADGWRLRDLKRVLAPACAFAALTLLVAAPWYVKNLLVFHNAFYPLLARPYLDAVLAPLQVAPAVQPPRSAWSLLRLPFSLLTTGSDLAITGRAFGDYLQLPLQAYLRGDLEVYGRPSLLFLAAPFSLLAWRQVTVRRLVLVTAALSVIWALGAQELRYVLPAFPLYALLASVVLAQATLAAAMGRLLRLLVRGAVVTVLLVTLGENALFLAARNPMPVLFGLQSRDAFLTRSVNVYGAYSYLERVMAPGQRALTLREDRGYYARVPMLFDGWGMLSQLVFVGPGSPTRTAALLRQEHVAYILLDTKNLDVPAVRDAFLRFQQADLATVYRQDSIRVYRVSEGA
ncbi:MAG TPA: glycosyltransferase family 39 protein [Chloroflexota bacterium]|nr:glycosyltransferase family 39 protein [Chloroflexota bacterium]